MKYKHSEKMMVHLNGEYNVDALDAIKEAFVGLIARKPKLILVNCSKLSGIDAEGTALLGYLTFSARMNGISVVYYDLSPGLRPSFAAMDIFKYATVISKEYLDGDYIHRFAQDSGYVEISGKI